MPLDFQIPEEFRRLVRFGSGVGIVIGPADLEVVVARVRPGSIQVLGRLTIRDFAARPAGEWGVEYAAFLKAKGASHISATVLLPRKDVIARQVALPGVASREVENAIRLQVDTLHPYGDQEIAWGWSALRPGMALVGVALRSTVERYVKIFGEAGVMTGSFTFSAAAVHAALRLDGAGQGAHGFVALGHAASGVVEVYGESPARGVFSAEFDMQPQRAAAIALSELRLPPETQPSTFAGVLPKPSVNPVENDLSRNALPYATALAGACPRLAPSANVLPAEHRRFSSRLMFVPTAALVALLLAALGGAVAWSRIEQKDYVEKMQAEIRVLQRQQQRAADLDRATDSARARAQWLDQYRERTRKDLDAFNELTNIIAPPAWTTSLDIVRDSIRVQGETPQASALWKIIDGSPLFVNSNLDYSQPSPGGGESFLIRAGREAGK